MYIARTIASRRQRASAGRFVGRAVEQRLFRATLQQLAALRDRGDDDLEDDELGYAQIFVVAAEGGMGKTSLLRRFEAIARENKEGAQAHPLYRAYPPTLNAMPTMNPIAYDNGIDHNENNDSIV